MTLYLGIGTNLGNRVQNIATALRLIGERVGKVEACSLIYESDAVGFKSDNRFANVALRVTTTLSPEDVLTRTEQIEREMGREHKSVNGHYEDRIIDIDLLCAYTDAGEQIVSDEHLQLPHPHMHEREFVIIPMQQVFIH